MAMMGATPTLVRLTEAKRFVEARRIEVMKHKQWFFDKLNSNTGSFDDAPNHLIQRDDADPIDEVTKAKLAGHATSKFGFNPLTVSLLLIVPPGLQVLGVSPWFYIPICATVLYYFQVQKDRQDRKAALGIVGDPDILRFVLKEVPNWYKDSEFHRVEWLNRVVEQLWPYVCTYVEKDVGLDILQKLLDSYKPTSFTELKVNRFWLGKVCPKIVGVRVYSKSGDSIKLDIDLKWAADPEVRKSVSLWGPSF